MTTAVLILGQRFCREFGQRAFRTSERLLPAVFSLDIGDCVRRWWR
jgi:hypothetical protein